MPDLWMDVDTALSEVPVNILPLLDATDFKTIEDAVAYNAAGLTLYWHFVTTGGAYSVTAVTPTTAGDYDWTDQGAAGIYTIEIPASGGASINNDTEGFGWFTGVATGVLPWRGPTIGFRASGLNDLMIDSAYSTTRGLAGTALPAAAADAAGGLIISDAGGLDADAQLVTKINDILTDTGTTLQGELDGIQVDTEDIQSRLPAALVSGRMDSSVGAMASDTLTAAALAADAVAEINATVDTAFADYDPPTRTEATADKNEIIAYLNGLVIAKGTIGATGNDTTHLHLTGLTYGNDEINNYLLAVYDNSAAEWHARYIEDWVDAGDLATVATLPFTPENSVDTYVILAFRQDVTGGSGLDAAGVRAAVGLASANLDTQLADLPTNAELSTALGTADDATLAAIAALNNLSAAQVNAEVDTALADINLDHLVKSGVDTNFATTVHLDSVIGQLADNGTTATFDRTTDSLEALQAEHDATQSTLTTILADTNELQTDLTNGGRLDLLIDAILEDTGTTLDDLIDDIESRLTATRAGYLDNLSAGAVATAASVSALNNLSAAQVNAEVVDALVTDVLADSIAADGSRPTIAQALLLIYRFLLERSVSGTTMTVKKEDGSTTSATFTLNDASSPTSITRAS